MQNVNYNELDRIIDEYESEHPLTLKQKLILLNAMYDEAKIFGHFNGSNILDRIDVDIRIAKILNEYV